MFSIEKYGLKYFVNVDIYFTLSPSQVKKKKKNLDILDLSVGVLIFEIPTSKHDWGIVAATAGHLNSRVTLKQILNLI